MLNVAKEKFSKMTEDLTYYSVTTGEILKEELNNSGLLGGIFRKLHTRLHDSASQSNAIMMEMNEAILRKKQPHTTTFVDMLASLGRYSKLVTIAKTAIELRKTYYDSIEGYQREKSVVEKLTKNWSEMIRERKSMA